MRTQSRKGKVVVLTAVVILLGLFIGICYWQAGGADISNPRGNFWRVVRHGIPAYSSTPAQGHTRLIVNSGENWREVRNGVILRGSQWILALALIGAGLFYFFVGTDKLEKPRSEVKIERFTLGERVLHWSTALLFILMAITGLSLLLGRLLLIPILGHPVVAGYLQISKAIHNYCGPLLLVGIFLAFVMWVRYNIPKKLDLQWFKNMGGMIGHGPRPHTGKVNAGEKGWFWLMVIFGIGVGITGVLLDFPIWGQTRFTMQLSHIIHVTVAVLFVACSFGHIYVGTIGSEGVFEGMWTGSVDAVWAQQHADLWYQEKIREIRPKPGAALS
ncbi:MAG: formate dehydrogenase subunit gamma [Thermodesulfobacteriota bacterium]